MKIKFLFLLLLSLLNVSVAKAAFSPISVGIIPPIEFPPDDYNITGLRLSLLYGKQRQVYGVDLGVLGNITENEFAGTAVSGLFNYTAGTTNILGVQLAGITNVNTNKTHIVGLQLALVANYNSAEATVAGVQLALANLSEHTKVYGAQLGVYNRAGDVYGFQVGLVNVATSLHGVQLGLLNFNKNWIFCRIADHQRRILIFGKLKVFQIFSPVYSSVD